jgi:uncharacterized caspase-like protein
MRAAADVMRIIVSYTRKLSRSMASDLSYLPTYGSSWALIIGINKYARCSPLGHACNDAQAVRRVLISKFGFPDENVDILLDEQATKAAILDAMMKHSAPDAGADDRILIFFAGHGYTSKGRRGDVGYLVPADGDCDKLASLIRWDELTRNADLLPAKHILFIMDACYGGLALTRHLHPGSRRFLKDMLRRYVRHVLAAGKPNEEVSDGDGPRADHSLFTGYFLEALEGEAAGKDGFLTANGVMAYVYDRVAKDRNSQQTPHYGYIDGTGDFIFTEPPADLTSEDEADDKDVLIGIPNGLADQMETDFAASNATRVKECLSEPRLRIKLDDLVNTAVREAAKRLEGDHFSTSRVDESVAKDFPKRLAAYEDAVRPIQDIAILLGKWADESQRSLLNKSFARIADQRAELPNGLKAWIGLKWYPSSLLLYLAGIAALSAERYDNFAAMHTTKVTCYYDRDITSVELILPVVDGILKMHQCECWKHIPHHEKFHTPHSEYMFKTVQPILEDVCLLGGSYDDLFDRYEVLRALMFADLDARDGSVWGPVGRFGWKRTGRLRKSDPFKALCDDAARYKDQWRPLKAGLFHGSYERFSEIATRFETSVLDRLQWF